MASSGEGESWHVRACLCMYVYVGRAVCICVAPVGTLYPESASLPPPSLLSIFCYEPVFLFFFVFVLEWGEGMVMGDK